MWRVWWSQLVINCFELFFSDFDDYDDACMFAGRFSDSEVMEVC